MLLKKNIHLLHKSTSGFIGRREEGREEITDLSCRLLNIETIDSGKQYLVQLKCRSKMNVPSFSFFSILTFFHLLLATKLLAISL